jgi:hypothetical protein
MFGTRRTWPLGDRRYAIESATGEQRWLVDLTKSPPWCSCPQYSYRCQGTDVCKHIVFFWAFGNWLERERRVPAS